MPFYQGIKGNSWLFHSWSGNRSAVSSPLKFERSLQCMPCSFQIVREKLPDNKCYFLKPVIHSQMI